jgi:hypothetical protein
MICMIYVRPEKTEFSYFLRFLTRTSLLFVFVLLDKLFTKTMVTLLYNVLLVSPSPYYTSLRYYVVLPSVIMLYFPPSQYYTSLRYHVVFSIMNYFYAKLWWVVYFSKLSIHTFCSYCCVLPVITILYFLLWKLFLYIFTRDRVYFPRLIYVFLIQTRVYFPSCYDIHFLCNITKDRVCFSKLDICTSLSY